MPIYVVTSSSLAHLMEVSDVFIYLFRPYCQGSSFGSPICAIGDDQAPPATRPDQTRPDPTRSDQTRPELFPLPEVGFRPDPTRPDQTRPDPTRPDQDPGAFYNKFDFISLVVQTIKFLLFTM